jgi:hypothetical protein
MAKENIIRSTENARHHKYNSAKGAVEKKFTSG